MGSEMCIRDRARDVALAFADGEYRRNVLRMLDARDGGRGKESVGGDGEL